MNCYALIDTNVLVSALLSSHEDAATVQVMVRLLSGEIYPCSARPSSRNTVRCFGGQNSASTRPR